MHCAGAARTWTWQCPAPRSLTGCGTHRAAPNLMHPATIATNNTTDEIRRTTLYCDSAIKKKDPLASSDRRTLARRAG
jgi:hypothetical protein